MAHVKFTSKADDYGMIAGTYRTDSRIGSVKLMPPSELWTGRFWREGQEPEAGLWTVYVVGVRLCQIGQRQNLIEELIQLLDEEFADDPLAKQH